MNKRDAKQRHESERWLKSNGVNVAHVYVGTTELFQATKLATTTLREHGKLLGHNEANTHSITFYRQHETPKNAKRLHRGNASK